MRVLYRVGGRYFLTLIQEWMSEDTWRKFPWRQIISGPLLSRWGASNCKENAGQYFCAQAAEMSHQSLSSFPHPLLTTALPSSQICVIARWACIHILYMSALILPVSERRELYSFMVFAVPTDAPVLASLESYLPQSWSLAMRLCHHVVPLFFRIFFMLAVNRRPLLDSVCLSQCNFCKCGDFEDGVHFVCSWFAPILFYNKSLSLHWS